jgi:hypothetical protein
MSYRCRRCDVKVPPGQPARWHRILRPNGQTEKELLVCGGCQRALAHGEPLVLPTPQPVNHSAVLDIENVPVVIIPPKPKRVRFEGQK